MEYVRLGDDFHWLGVYSANQEAPNCGAHGCAAPPPSMLWYRVYVLNVHRN